ESVTDWGMMWVVSTKIAPGDLWILAGLIFGALIVAGREWSLRERDGNAVLPFYRQPALHSPAILACLLAFGKSQLYSPYSPRLALTATQLKQSTLNSHDAALQHKGYYEKLDNVSRMSAQLWDVQAQRPAHWVGLASTDAYYVVHNSFIRGDLRPNVHITF